MAQPAALEWQLAEGEALSERTQEAIDRTLERMQAWRELDFPVELRVTDPLTGEAVTSARVGDILHVHAILNLPEEAYTGDVPHLSTLSRLALPAFTQTALVYDSSKLELIAPLTAGSAYAHSRDRIDWSQEPAAILQAMKAPANERWLVGAAFVVRQTGSTAFTTVTEGTAAGEGQGIVPSGAKIPEGLLKNIAHSTALQEFKEEIEGNVQHATASIELTAAGARPTAQRDTYNLTRYKGALEVSSEQGLLANDAGGAGAAALLVRGPEHGTVKIAPDGSFRYAFSFDRLYHISDTFTYVVVNADGTSEFTEVEVRADQVPALAEVSLRAIDAGGNELSSVVVGQPFYLQGVVNDLRLPTDDNDGPRGATKIAFDLSFDNDALKVAGPVEIHYDFDGESVIPGRYIGQPTASVRPGDIRVLGISGRGPMPGELEVFRVPMLATAEGMSEIKVDRLGLHLRPGLVNPPPRLVQIHGLSLDVQANPLDVTGDGNVLASDALAVINHLNAFGAGSVAEGESAGRSALDADRNNAITAADALAIINYLNSGLGNTPVESPAAAVAVTSESDWLALLAEDMASDSRKQ